MMFRLDRIPAFFADWVAANGNKGAVGEVADWLASGGFEPAEFAQIVERHGVRHEAWFRDGLLDLAVAFVRESFQTGVLNAADATDIRLLRRILHIEDAALFDHRRTELCTFLQETLETFLVDGAIDESEDLCLVEIQAAFGLSYDQMLSLARPALEAAVADLSLSTGEARNPERLRVTGFDTLESIYLLANKQRRSAERRY